MAKPALAIRSAVQQAHPGASVDARGPNWLRHTLPNGQRRLDVSMGPIHTAALEEIETDWLADTGAWQWQMIRADYHAHARDTFNAGSLLEYRDPVSQEWVIFDPQSINWINEVNSRQQIATKAAVSATVAGDRMSFPNGYGTGRHFSYQLQTGRLLKLITIDSLASLPTPTVSGTVYFEAEFSISASAGVAFYLDGALWTKVNNQRVRTANRIECRDAATGQSLLWVLDLPRATDSAQGDTIGQFEVRRSGGASSLFITVRIPKTWIDAATFPIHIDPSISAQVVGASSDDATEASSGTVTLTDFTSPTQLDNTAEWHGVRWNISGSTIASGSTITACTVTCEFQNSSLDEPLVTMFFQEAAAPGTFTTATNNISSRSRTTASVVWSSTDLGSTGAGIGGGDDFTSPDLSTPLQEVVDSQGTLSAIAWIVQGGSSSTRDFSVTCYDGSTTTCPRLSVTWTEPGGGGTTHPGWFGGGWW